MPKILAKFKKNPNNPRFIKDARFEALVKSIKDFPKMMELRPMIYDKTNVVIAGNQRYEACLALGMKEVPDSWMKAAGDLTEEERRRFIMMDNEPFGETDWDRIANEWSQEELIDWGVEIPDFNTNTVQFTPAAPTGLKLKVTFQTENQVEEVLTLLKKWGIENFKLK